MSVKMVQQIELFSEAELENLQFLPEELEEIQSEKVQLERFSFLKPLLKNVFKGKLKGGRQVSRATRGRPRSKKPSARLTFMGRTPGKHSKQGRLVWNRWFKKGKARHHPTKGPQVYVKTSSNGPRRWLPFDRNIHMGHKYDVVKYWNYGVKKTFIARKLKYLQRYKDYLKPGRLSGAKSKLVRKFMLDHRNYRFELGRLNSSAGAKLRIKYKKP